MKYGVEMMMLRDRINKLLVNVPTCLELDELEGYWADFSYEVHHSRFLNILSTEDDIVCEFIAWLDDADIEI